MEYVFHLKIHNPRGATPSKRCLNFQIIFFLLISLFLPSSAHSFDGPGALTSSYTSRNISNTSDICVLEVGFIARYDQYGNQISTRPRTFIRIYSGAAFKNFYVDGVEQIWYFDIPQINHSFFSGLGVINRDFLNNYCGLDVSDFNAGFIGGYNWEKTEKIFLTFVDESGGHLSASQLALLIIM